MLERLLAFLAIVLVLMIVAGATRSGEEDITEDAREDAADHGPFVLSEEPLDPPTDQPAASDTRGDAGRRPLIPFQDR